MFLIKLLMISAIIMMMLLYINLFFFFSEEQEESSSPFECGIDPMNEVKAPFYMHFMYISILFLVFDVELALSIPLITTMISEKLWNFFWFSFISILMMGLMFEIFLGTIDWKE